MGRRNSTAAPETRRWHFVSIPIHPNAGEPSGYDAVRDCPQQECVVRRSKSSSASWPTHKLRDASGSKRSNTWFISSVMSTNRFMFQTTTTVAAMMWR